MEMIETLQKIATLLSLVGGGAAALWTLAEKGRESRLRLTRSELELITHPAGFPASDDRYREFIEDLAKERRTQTMFRRPIPNGKLGPLMEFYRLGHATIGEISAAWPHHEVANGRLSFQMSRTDRLRIWVIHSYAVLCSGMASLIGVALVFSGGDLAEKIRLSSLAILLIATAVVVYWSSSDVFAAKRLSKIPGHGDHPT